MNATANKSAPAAPRAPAFDPQRLMTVLLAPVISEKGTHIADKFEQVIFRVAQDATKPDIKAAVELMFEVKVDSVQVLNAAGKGKRFGGRQGRRSDFKKAYVRLAAGQTIDFTGVGK
jgi:large subunit ribosomal protein L23